MAQDWHTRVVIKTVAGWEGVVFGILGMEYSGQLTGIRRGTNTTRCLQTPIQNTQRLI